MLNDKIMIFLTTIIGIIILFLIIQYLQWNDEKQTYGFGIFCGCLLGMMLVFEVILICESISESHPTALDVYQGKTTIEYTIRDGEVIDSVVVFKEKII